MTYLVNLQAEFLGKVVQVVEAKHVNVAHTVKVPVGKQCFYCHYCLWTTQMFQEGAKAGCGVHSTTFILTLEYIECILYV